MNDNNASDLFLTVGLEPAVKLDGHLTPIEICLRNSTSSGKQTLLFSGRIWGVTV